MDARSFGKYLVNQFSELTETLKNNLINGAYKEIQDTLKASGTHAVLADIVSKMDNLVDDFEKKYLGSNDSNGAA